MAVVDRRRPAGVVLEAPTQLPAAPGVANSARVLTSRTGFSVSLFHCPIALGVDASGVGTGACGAMANADGSFGAEQASSVRAARSSLRRGAAAPPGCGERSQVRLEPGHWATVAVDPSTGVHCQASWHQDTWTLVLSGDLASRSGGWLAVAKGAAAYLDAHPLPLDRGVVVADLAPDGTHSEARWVAGTTVESASEVYGLRADLALVRAMRRWSPG